MRVVQAGEEIENGAIGFDGVVSEATTVNLTEVKELQRIGHEVCGAENEEIPGVEAAVLAGVHLGKICLKYPHDQGPGGLAVSSIIWKGRGISAISPFAA